MALVSLEDAKNYLRVDTSDDDDLIDILLTSARQLCADVARLSGKEEEEVENGNDCYWDGCIEDDDRGNQKAFRSTMRIAELYALGYLYEHREEADYHELALTLRNILFAEREGKF